MLEELRCIVRRTVNEADPVHLLEMGAPEDEYEAEVDQIVREIIHKGPVIDGVEMVLLIQEVFDRWFYPGKVSWEQSLAMAQGIHLELRQQAEGERAHHESADGDNP